MKSEQTNPPEPFPREPIPPEILSWARQNFDEKEFLQQIREIETNGGLGFESFIGEIEAIVRSR